MSARTSDMYNYSQTILLKGVGMTEEALKDEICEYVHNIYKAVPLYGFSKRDLRDVAEHFALPREKQIVELEKQNKKLQEEGEKIFNDWPEACNKYGKVNLELENKNTINAFQYNHMQTLDKKLLKAETIIKKLLSKEMYNPFEVLNIRAEAEEFLKEK